MIESKTPSGAFSRADIVGLVKLSAGLLAAGLAVSVALAALMLWGCGPKALARGLILATMTPLLLGVPLLCYLSFQMLKLQSTVLYLEGFAHRDALTQLLNRGAFTRCIEEKLAEMRSLTSARGAMLIADADHFKAINDRWGHAMGDEALRRIGHEMSKVLQRDDLIGRLGGEEFGIFLYGSSPSSARAVAERLRAAVQAIDLRAADGQRVGVTISIGAIHFRQPLPFATLYNAADRNLYLAKESGRNRVDFEDAAMEAYAEQAA